MNRNIQLRGSAVAYDPVEDRLVLRFATNQSELWFHLTRKVVKALWELIERQLSTRAAAGEPARAEAAKAILGFKQAAAGSDVEMRKTQRKPSDPNAPPPILVTQLQVAPGKDGRFRFSIADDNKNGLSLGVGEPFLLRLRTMLAKAETKADWGLDLEAKLGEVDDDLSRPVN